MTQNTIGVETMAASKQPLDMKQEAGSRWNYEVLGTVTLHSYVLLWPSA